MTLSKFLCRNIYDPSLVYQLIMFGWCCFGAKSPQPDFPPTSKFYHEVNRTLTNHQQLMLELIYTDLATRHKSQRVSFENFLVFFGLTGLWGAKLFRQFDQDGNKLIDKQQFFYGISQTAKAPHSQKIKLLFNFLKDDKDNGIKSVDFTKMLYNYSKDELKQILIEEKTMMPELNRAISNSTNSQQQPQHNRFSPCGNQHEPSSSMFNSPLRSKTKGELSAKPTVIEVKTMLVRSTTSPDKNRNQGSVSTMATTTSSSSRDKQALFCTQNLKI